jgi:putative transposase
VDKHGQTIDFLLTEHRDTEAALRFLKKTIRRNGLPETITIDAVTPMKPPSNAITRHAPAAGPLPLWP